MKKIVLVTGANKGIGLEICRQLCEKEFNVILTARDEQKGKKAADSISGNIFFHQLDVTDPKSISKLKIILEEKFGKLDVLINNAAILLDEDIPALSVDIGLFRETLETNLVAPLQLIQSLIPLIYKSKSGRIINVSSGMGILSQMGGRYAGYRVSKAGLNALTIILANELEGSNITVNSMTPGWVRTDMGGSNADLSLQEGADTAVWLATDENIPNGRYFKDRKDVGW